MPEAGAVGLTELSEYALGFGAAGGLDRGIQFCASPGWLDQGRATVVRIGSPLHESLGFQTVDDLGRRTGRDVQVYGKLGEPGPFVTR